MKYTGKEAKRIIAKTQSGETLTDDEVKYLVQVAKKSIELLPDRVGSWMLAMLVVITTSTMNGQEQVDEVLDELFSDGD